MSEELPVEAIRAKLTEKFKGSEPRRVLLKAPTGSGKSTSVPSMMLDAEGIIEEGLIVVIQPRRIAARMLAKRVSFLRGSDLGGEVGYVVRFDNKQSTNTKIVFVTDGIFQNWLESNPTLEGISCVIFDEFHERRVAGDVSLALTMELQETSRPLLSLIVMSATLEMGNLAEFMAPVRELEAYGRTFPVEMSYEAPEQVAQRGFRHNSREGIWDHCFKAAKKAISMGEPGHILIFLPGVHEIRKTVTLLESSSHFRDWKVCPLYSALPPRLQDEAVAFSEQPKIIVSTNVAETSLTIDGVKTVIDSGLARVSEFDANRGIETLLVKKISQAAADQRAGRAGRTAPGRCVRLWSHSSHAKREAFELPEIRRGDIAELSLKLLARGRKVADFNWLDAPFDSSVEQAGSVLRYLDAVDVAGEITELGEKMAIFPLPPRFSRLIFAGEEEGCLAEACFIAAAIQGEGIFTKRRGTVGRSDFIYASDGSDFAGEYRGYESAESLEFQPKRCGDLGILARGARECGQSMRQIHEYVGNLGLQLRRVDFDRRSDAVSAAAVKAFGDRIGIRHNQNSLASRLSDGRRGMLDGDSAAKASELFIPTEITEVDGRDVVVHFNRCVCVSGEMIRQRFPEDVVDSDEVEFDVVTRRVERKQVTRFKGLLIEEKSGGAPDLELAGALLAERVAAGELILNQWDKSVDSFIARFLGLREWMPELELPDFTEEDRALALEQVCHGAVSYKEIKNREVLPAVKSWLSEPQIAALNAFAPKEITLENGKKAKVYYETGKKPWIAMRAQLLFGVRATPTIANGLVKLNIHICAPNNRPWQITDDLENFWKSGFEQMRKDLGGRYPKHQWSLD